jgi:hypothetical protein
MQSSSKLRRAIRSAVLLSAAGGVVASPAMAQLEEVIVTATKRSASTQDIPLAVQALGENTLNDMGVTNFEDYLVQLPGVTAGGSARGRTRSTSAASPPRPRTSPPPALRACRRTLRCTSTSSPSPSRGATSMSTPLT